MTISAASIIIDDFRCQGRSKKWFSFGSLSIYGDSPTFLKSMFCTVVFRLIALIIFAYALLNKGKRYVSRLFRQYYGDLWPIWAWFSIMTIHLRLN